MRCPSWTRTGNGHKLDLRAISGRPLLGRPPRDRSGLPPAHQACPFLLRPPTPHLPIHVWAILPTAPSAMGTRHLPTPHGQSYTHSIRATCIPISALSEGTCASTGHIPAPPAPLWHGRCFMCWRGREKRRPPARGWPETGRLRPLKTESSTDVPVSMLNRRQALRPAQTRGVGGKPIAGRGRLLLAGGSEGRRLRPAPWKSPRAAALAIEGSPQRGPSPVAGGRGVRRGRTGGWASHLPLSKGTQLDGKCTPGGTRSKGR